MSDDPIVVIVSNPNPDETLIDVQWPNGIHQEFRFKAYKLPKDARIEKITFRVTMPYPPYEHIEVPLRSVTMTLPAPYDWDVYTTEHKWSDEDAGWTIEV